MKIINAKVNWNDHYSNDPELVVLVDEIPNRSDIVYNKLEMYGGALYYGEKGGYSSYMYHDPLDEKGYGGAVMEIEVHKVGKETIRGPWSSRCGVVNRAGFGPCLDASMTTDPKAFERGFTLMAGAITREVAEEAVNMMDGIVLEKVVVGKNEFRFVPRKEVPRTTHEFPKLERLILYLVTDMKDVMIDDKLHGIRAHFRKYYGAKGVELLGG